MGRQRQEVGFTILEGLVAGACLLLLLGVMVQVLLPAFRITAKASTRSELHQRGHRALDLLAVDLQGTVPAGLAIYTTSPRRALIGLHQVVDSDPAGDPVYAGGLILYLWENRQLTRAFYQDPDPGFSTSPHRPAVEQLETYLALARERRPLCSDVETFQVTDSDPEANRLRQPMQLRLELLHGSGAARQTMVLSQKVTMRNR